MKRRREEREPSKRGLDRETFMRRLREGLGVAAGGRTIPDAPAVESFARLVRPDDDLVARFESAAAESGMQVRRAAPGEVESQIRVLLEALGPGRVAISAGAGLAETLEAAVAAAGGSCVSWRGGPGLESLFDADVGITDVAAAVAETGSLLLASDADHSRGGFLVPPVHVALVRAEQIVADLIDLWPGWHDGSDPPAPSALPAGEVLVTGPSKTADIEGILVTGVHGPRVVHVVLVSPGARP